MRSFQGGKIQAGVHFQIASGYTGQTTEVLALQGEGDPFEILPNSVAAVHPIQDMVVSCRVHGPAVSCDSCWWKAC